MHPAPDRTSCPSPFRLIVNEVCGSFSQGRIQSRGQIDACEITVSRGWIVSMGSDTNGPLTFGGFPKSEHHLLTVGPDDLSDKGSKWALGLVPGE